MHRYEPSHHHFTIRSFDYNASPAEILQAPAILLNEHFIYRRTPRIGPILLPHPASEPDRLVGTVTTPIRQLKDLLTDAELLLYRGGINVTNDTPSDFPLISRESLINATTRSKIFPVEQDLNTQPNIWKLHNITLGAKTTVFHLVYSSTASLVDTLDYAHLWLSDVMIMQMQCSLTVERDPGHVTSEHYTCSTHPSTHNNDHNSFRVEYHSTSLSTPHPSAIGAKTIYSHSEITYEDSYQ